MPEPPRSLAPQYLADQLTLFQPGRADYPHQLLLDPQCFSPSGITVCQSLGVPWHSRYKIDGYKRSVTYSLVALFPVTGISPSFLMLSGFLGSSSKAPNRSSSSILIEKLENQENISKIREIFHVLF